MKLRNLGYLANKYWFFLFSAVFLIFVGLPFLAPVLMKMGLTKAAGVIYAVYRFLCHQLPQRSFFLFGDKFMYSLPEIHSAWQPTLNPMILRKFIGNPQTGWKVAWSDRMVSMYSSIMFASWIWYPVRKKIKSIPFWAFVIFLLPMAVDGITHMISDFAGIGQGFRDNNLWLAQLTSFKYEAAFYTGDAWGSFNSWMRLLTGILFGTGIVLYGFPYIAEIFESNAGTFEANEQKLNLLRERALQDIKDFQDQTFLEKDK